MWKGVDLRGWAQDVVLLAGVGSIGYGLWLIYEPGMWLWAGVVLLATAYGWANGTRDA